MEQWPKLLYTYGPFSLLVLSIFVIEWKARNLLKDSSIPSRLSVSVYLLNWCMIFVLCGAVTYFWVQLNLPKAAMIQGDLTHLKEDETVFSDSPRLYLQRIYGEKNRFGYNWRLITPEPLPDGTKQSFTINFGQGDNARAFVYDMTIWSSFYRNEVHLTYERDSKKLLLDHEGKQEELIPREDFSAQRINAAPWRLLPIAYAQSSVSLDGIFNSLESDDPIIRRDARRDLAAQGQAALPRIEKALQDPKSSYRVQLGTIVALNNMRNATVDAKTRAAITAIAAAASEAHDPVLNSEAIRYLHNLPAPTCGIRCGVERWAVKTLTDDDVGKVDFGPVSKTIGDLVALSAPNSSSETSRLDLTERTTFKVRARLLGYKHETDRDFHIVIADLVNPSQTMIVEIPDPDCGGACASPKLSDIQKARQDFAAQFPNAPPAPQFKVVQGNVVVEVTGVGFFDFAHGQTGLAQNCIELHPVLAIAFPTPGPFDAKADPQAEPPRHPNQWYRCIPRSSP